MREEGLDSALDLRSSAGLDAPSERAFDHTFTIWQDGMQVVRVQGPRRDVALREIAHYALVYGQDGPLEAFELIGRRKIPLKLPEPPQ